MKKEKTARRIKKVTLNRETIKNLENHDLSKIAGGDDSIIPTRCGFTCSGLPNCAHC